MVYSCNICNYHTTVNHALKNHLKTQKHIKQVELTSNTDKFECSYCNKKYSKNSSLYRHIKISHKEKDLNSNPNTNLNTNLNSDINSNINSNINNIIAHKYESDIESIKQEYKLKLELEKLKFENKIMENRIESIENSHRTMCNIMNNSNNINNTTIINISKVQFLNHNFGNVLDINTFIENYKTKYGLTNEQALTLLENYQNDGVNGCVNSLIYYLKKSAVQQYKELQGKEIAMENIILPFLLSDCSLREHFEKTDNGNWDKTTMIENIKKIVTITNDQVFNHHNQYMNISGTQKKRIINGLLKSSCYALLAQITIPELYKSEDADSDKNKENKKLTDSQSANKIEQEIKKQIVKDSFHNFADFEFDDDEEEDEDDEEYEDDEEDEDDEDD